MGSFDLDSLVVRTGARVGTLAFAMLLLTSAASAQWVQPGMEAEPEPAPQQDPYPSDQSEWVAPPPEQQPTQPITRSEWTEPPPAQVVSNTAAPRAPGQPARAARGAIGVDFAFFTRGVDEDGFVGTTTQRTTGISPLFSGHYRVMPKLRLDAAFGLAGTRFSISNDAVSESEGTVRFSNIVLGARYVHESGDIQLAVGGQLALPTASVSDDDPALGGAAYALASGMRGLRDQWLWTPDYVSIVIPADLTLTRDKLTVRAQFALGLLLATDDGLDTEFVTQLYAEVGYRVANPLIIGGGLSAVANLTSEDGQDGFQAALSIFMRFPVMDRLMLHTELWMNLDDPLGFAFESSDDGFGVWGLRFGATFTL